MKVKYLGPRDSVNVGEFGPHAKGQVKNYKKEIAEELVKTANRQSFEIVEDKGPKDQKSGASEDQNKGKKEVKSAPKTADKK